MSDRIDGATLERLNHVETVLNYLANPADRPVTYMYEPPQGVPVNSGKPVRQPVRIYDGRPLAERLTMDGQGFMLTRHETAVVDFYNEDEVKRVYYPEVERLVRERLGATRVVVFDHNVRCAPMAQRKENGAREPVRFAHNDYTFKSAPQRVRDLLPAAEAEALLQHRFGFVNVWRPIRGPVEESPLAVCDAESMAVADFVPSDLKYRDRIGEVYSVAYNPQHRWFYFPRMQRNEALLLKCFDSADDGRARFTAHTAFEDPTSPASAAPRESIEARTLVFFAPVAS